MNNNYLKNTLLILILICGMQDISLGAENRWSHVKKVKIRGHEGEITFLTINPSNQQILYAVVCDSLIFKSKDGGKNWNDISNNIYWSKINKLIASPTDSNTIFICTDTGIYSTDANNKRWDFWALEDSAVFDISFALDRDSTKIQYVALENSILKANKNSDKYNFKSLIKISDKRIYSVASDTSDNIYVGTERGLYKYKTDGAIIDSTEGFNINDYKIVDLEFGNINSDIIFAITENGGVFCSDCDSWTWLKMDQGWHDKIQFILNGVLFSYPQKRIYIFTIDGSIYRYDFFERRIGFFEVETARIAPWERERIQNLLYLELKKKFPFNIRKIDNIQIYNQRDENFYQQFRKLYGIDIFITCHCIIEKSVISISPKIAVYDKNKYKVEPIDVTKDKINDYYPKSVKRSANKIACKIKNHNLLFCKWKETLGHLTKGVLFATTSILIYDHLSNKKNSKIKIELLPNPK
ncbi:MAG: hypothetical protein GF353_09165 [Candidatus Lokiarchaeota archaeon]|nr:hypothetical protein [Candidatus Lokiarchaeota archaeon]